ncbi:kinase-like domain-containing protein [Russula vinacea]|nr:kinase-like domain-containing protein [Russula vinacea]
MHRYSSPLPSPSPSPLRASFPESASEELRQEQEQDERGEETEKALPQVPYVTPPPSAPPVTVRRPPITIATDLENVIGIPVSLSTPMIQVEDIENGPVLASTPSYPSWLAAIVLPLAEFIDDRADPRVLFTDLQEIGQGESGSVYSACAAPTVAPQFRPPTPCSPVSEISLSEGDEADEGRAQPKQGLVAIKCVPLLRGGTEKLADLRRELELTRALRHPNLLYMERLYVDVAEESLWIGMELMDRSLADVLAVVGEETGSAQVALETQEDGGDGDSGSGPGGAGVVEISEKMIARFMWDVLLALSYIRKHHIAHRDVRSDNLLLSKSGVLKLSDFSNAVCSPSGTPKRSDPVGVIYWQAPEMRTGLYDPLKVDVWSLGATTWELAHGDPPFEDVQDMRDIVGAQLRPCDSPRPSHDLFTIFCIHVLSPLPRDRIRTNCLKLTSYGLRAHAQRLSGCWDSAGQLMSSRYFGRVTNSDFHLFKKNQTLSPSTYFTHLNPPITLPKCLVGYTTNIIQLLLLLFSLYGSPRSSLPTAAACHVMLPSTIALSASLFTIYRQNHGKESIFGKFFFARQS